MNPLAHRPRVLLAACLATVLSAALVTPARADRDDRGRDDHHRRGPHAVEYKEKFRDGPCMVEREIKADGSYKEERECKGGRAGPDRAHRGEHAEKFRDGPCKIEREWKRDGSYKEKIDCKGEGRRPGKHARVVIAQPPWIMKERTGPLYRPGWEPPPVVKAPSGSIIRCNRDIIGGVIGGVAGGLLGSQIGKGDGRTAATIGGAIAGVLLGGAIGRDMDAQDQACVAHALEFAETGQKVTWRDPRGGRDYVVIPGAIERRPDGRYCRDYEMDAPAGSSKRHVRGTACRQPDGLWGNAD